MSDEIATGGPPVRCEKHGTVSPEYCAQCRIEELPRPLKERLKEYGDALLSMSTQIEAVLANLKPAETLTEADARASLQAAVDVYRIIGGEDIPKLVAGEELKRWAILSN